MTEDEVRRAQLKMSKRKALQTTKVQNLPEGFDVTDERFKAVMLKWALDIEDGSVPLDPLQYAPAWDAKKSAADPSRYVVACNRVWDVDTGSIYAWAITSSMALTELDASASAA